MNYRAIGIMSGTSLDGLDIACCTFSLMGKSWSYAIEKAVTIIYNDEWRQKLSGAQSLNGLELAMLDREFGGFIGEEVGKAVNLWNLSGIDLIASHGHTVFHQPSKKITLQIGHGAAIAASSGITTVCDFRSMDVILGGQGAPLVPVGDKHLFGEYAACINLGGIANISYDINGKRIAYDIVPCNIPLNWLAERAGEAFDDGGRLSLAGNISIELLKELNQNEYYNASFPKSLGREWIDENCLKLVDASHATLPDKLRTVTEHIAAQISASVKPTPPGEILISGGGAFNSFLIERIKALSGRDIFLPGKDIINFREALIFAFLGVLRLRNETNTLASVTGASMDSCGGSVYLNK